MKNNNCVVSLDDSNFDEVLHSIKDTRLFLVDFWAEWCGPCKVFSPILEEVAIEYNENVQFGKFNVDGSSLIVKKYNIRSIPTLLLFKKYVVIHNKIGLLSKKQLKEFLDINLEFGKSKNG